MTIVSRFAPSPTGHLHLGNIRTAIIAYMCTRHAGGKFILRIEDTDVGRSKEEFTQSIKQDLNWAGVTWDEYVQQVGREPVYNKAREQLIASGRLYPCYETEEELALKRKVQLGRGQPPIYDRAALKLTPEQKAKYEAEGRQPHYRFMLKHEPIKWEDQVRGHVEFHGKDLSDPVLYRADGTALYHLGNVVDDIDQGVTYVVRGEDHVTNTAMHIQMFEALGAKVPMYAHLPLMFDDEGKKFSKRAGSLSIGTLRDEEGLEPIAIAAFLGRLGTSQPIEPFWSLDEFIKQFDITHFSKANPKFIYEDLLRLNGRILHQMKFEDVKARLEQMGLNGVTEEFWLAARPNLTVLKDIKDWWHVANGPVKPVIADKDFAQQAAALLPAEPWDDKTWSTWANAIKDKTGRKGKDLFMPLRQALTGMDHGPEMANLLPLIGYERTAERLKQAA